MTEMEMNDEELSRILQIQTIINKKMNENQKTYEQRPFNEIYCYEKELMKFYPNCIYKLYNTNLKTKSGNRKCIWRVFSKDHPDIEIASHRAIRYNTSKGSSISIFREPSLTSNPWELPKESPRQTNDYQDL